MNMLIHLDLAHHFYVVVHWLFPIFQIDLVFLLKKLLEQILLDLTSLDFANLSTTYNTSESKDDATIASNEDIILYEDNDDMYNFTHDIFDSTFSSLLIADSFISPKLN